MHAVTGELAVPLAQRARTPGIAVGLREGAALHPRRRLHAGDGAERRRQIDLPYRVVTTAGSMPAEGAGRHTKGNRISASVWYGPL